jgi:hypothetical protein
MPQDLEGTATGATGAVAVDVALSRQVGNAFRTSPKKCYWNCYRIMASTFNVSDYDDAYWTARLGPGLRAALHDLCYVEGFAVAPSGLVFPHAWIETRGTIIDPTLVRRPPPALRSLLGDAPGDPSGYVYVGAHRLTHQEAARLLAKRGGTPLTFEGDSPDLSDPLWRAAWEACCCLSSNRALRLPNTSKRSYTKHQPDHG